MEWIVLTGVKSELHKSENRFIGGMSVADLGVGLFFLNLTMSIGI